MTLRSVFRFAEWTLSPDASYNSPLYSSACSTCGAASERTEDKEAAELWCLKHAGLTAHTEFRGIITTFFRAALAE